MRRRAIKVKVPETHPTKRFAARKSKSSSHLKDIKRLELAEIDEEFLESLGFTNEKELRDALREQMEERIGYDVQQSMREQVNKHLLETSQLICPRESQRSADRSRGQSQDGRSDDARHAARADRAAGRAACATAPRMRPIRELKLFFILQKIAADEKWMLMKPS